MRTSVEPQSVESAAGSADLATRFQYEHEVEHEFDGNGLDEFAVEDEHDSAAERAGAREVAAEQPDELAIWPVEGAPVVQPSPIETPRVERPRVETRHARARRWPIVIPLAVGAIAASAGYVRAARDAGGLPPLPAAPAGWSTAEPHRAEVPTPDVPRAAVLPRREQGAVQADAAPRPAAVDEALASVSRSYRALDAASLAQVWPGADVAVLSARFSTLKYQSLSFDRCKLRPAGAQVVASCEVSAAAAANAGDQALQRRRESWSIVFDRSGDRYVIGSVAVAPR